MLVATDIAARGLDIDQLPQVVNFELPNVPEDYVHRIGRTGRAGASGEAISLVDEEDAKRLEDIEKLLNRKFPRETAAVKGGYHNAGKSHAVRHHAARPAPVDDWFSRPYEPAASSQAAEERAAPAAPKKPQKQVAALFRARPQATD